MPQQNMQELAHALFQYIKEVCQLTQKEIFDVDKQARMGITESAE